MNVGLSELLLSVFVCSATLSLIVCWRAQRHERALGLLWQLLVCSTISAWALWLDADHTRLTQAWPWCAMLTLLVLWGLTERAARSFERPPLMSTPSKPL